MFNLVTANYSVDQISGVIERLYPAVEKRYVSQDMTLGSILVQPNERVLSVPVDAMADLQSHLTEMKSRFSIVGN
jgi:hypothetical protein